MSESRSPRNYHERRVERGGQGVGAELVGLGEWKMQWRGQKSGLKWRKIEYGGEYYMLSRSNDIENCRGHHQCRLPMSVVVKLILFWACTPITFSLMGI